MKVRVAEMADIEAMVRLSETFRTSLADYSPTFWRKAPDSFEKQVGWFRIILPLDETLAFVAEADSELRGFVLGRLQGAPPVYAPGGPVCIVDDFCVASDAEWSSVGSDLLAAVERSARDRGAVLSIVVCPRLAAAKREFLGAGGFEATAEWHVRDL